MLAAELHGSKKLEIYLMDYYRTPVEKRKYVTLMQIWRDVLTTADAFRNLQSEDRVEKQRHEELLQQLGKGVTKTPNGQLHGFVDGSGKGKKGKDGASKGKDGASKGKQSGAPSGKGTAPVADPTNHNWLCMPFQDKWHKGGFTCSKTDCWYKHEFFASKALYDAATKPVFFTAKLTKALGNIDAAAAALKGKGKSKSKDGGKTKEKKGKRAATPPPPEIAHTPNDPRHKESGKKARAFVLHADQLYKMNWNTMCKTGTDCKDDACRVSKYHFSSKFAAETLKLADAQRAAFKAVKANPAGVKP